MKYIIQFLKFILPILGKAGVRACVDEAVKYAYPEQPRRRRPSYAYYAPRPSSSRVGPNPFVEKPINLDGPGFHDVLMIAFDISGANRQIVEEWLYQQMPKVDEIDEDTGVHVDSWWLADDNRLEPTDTDSAVFVAKGNQSAARKLLREHGLTH